MATASVPPSSTPSVDPAAALNRAAPHRPLRGLPRELPRPALDRGDVAARHAGRRRSPLVLKHPGALRAMFWPFDNVGARRSVHLRRLRHRGRHLRLHRLAPAHRRGRGSRDRCGRSSGSCGRCSRLPKQQNPRDLSKAGRPDRGRPQQGQRDRDAISYTYDLPGEFYRLFLDKNMQYTCGYFAYSGRGPRRRPGAEAGLHLPQAAAEAGRASSWTSAAAGAGSSIHAAKHYGVEAIGVTLSGEQAKWCERAIDEAGLARPRARSCISDYRDFNDPGEFDKASSVGMARAHRRRRTCRCSSARCTSACGPAACTCTTASRCGRTRRTRGGRRSPASTCSPTASCRRSCGCRRARRRSGSRSATWRTSASTTSYTLENWVRKLEANHDEVLKLVGEVSYRIFRIYMAGATLRASSTACTGSTKCCSPSRRTGPAPPADAGRLVRGARTETAAGLVSRG